ITRVRKSPNMMSTTGLMPVMAAPSPMPVMPASEIGESSTRSGPNSSTSPDVTLNGVPASATSSPMRKTVGSRRNSSASASLTACANEISRVPACSFGMATSVGVDMFVNLSGIGEGSLDGVLGRGLDLGLGLSGDALERGFVGHALFEHPGAQDAKRVALRLPPLLLVLRAVVGPVHVSDVVPVVTVGLADEEARPLAGARARDRSRRGGVDGANVLAVEVLVLDAEGRGAFAEPAGRRLAVVRVLVVGVVLADVDDRERPQRRHVHHLVENALAQRAFAEEADGHLVGATRLRREG